MLPPPFAAAGPEAKHRTDSLESGTVKGDAAAVFQNGVLATAEGGKALAGAQKGRGPDPEPRPCISLRDYLRTLRRRVGPARSSFVTVEHKSADLKNANQ